MDGFKIDKPNDAIEVFHNKAGLFRLLVEDDDLEVFESNINAGKSIICQPYESKDAMNILLVLEGKMFHTNDRQFIKAGDRITFKNLQETHHISVLETTKLIMIRNSKHFIKQASSADRTYALIHQIQEKDQYTEDHCNNTGNLAVQIATLMQLPEKAIENILYAGKIHDVGKINVPIHILNKNDRLTDEEYEIMKRHPQDGYQIVLDNMNHPELAAIVLDHHERLDGSGYPHGKCGDAISIEAKVLAVADSYDAMTSNRPYKEAKSVEDALNELKRLVGTWYDEKVVSALCEILSYTHHVVSDIRKID